MTKSELQQESDSAFNDGEEFSDITDELAAERASDRAPDSGEIAFADSDDDPMLDTHEGDETVDLTGQQGEPRRRPTKDFAADDDQGGQGGQGGDVEPEPQDAPFDDAILARAEQYGIPRDQVSQQFANADQLDAAMTFMDQRAFQQYQQQQYQQQQYQQYQQQQYAQQQQQYRQQQYAQQQPQAGVTNPQGQQVAGDGQQQDAFQPYELQSADMYDEVLTTDLQGMQGHLLGIIQQQRQMLDSVGSKVAYHEQLMQQQYQHQLNERAAREFEEFEGFVTSDLGEDWSDVFGNQATTSLAPNSQEMINRRALYDTANSIRQMHANEGRNVSVKAVMPSALKLAFPTRSETARSWGQPRDAHGRFTARPTRRKRAPATNGRARALARADAYFKKRGFDVDVAEEDFSDGV